METDVNGCSTCPRGTENFEVFISRSGKQHVQYDYRDTDGELFSTIAVDLDTARIRRDEWLFVKEKARQ